MIQETKRAAGGQAATPLQPLQDRPALKSSEWIACPLPDPAVDLIVEHLWPGPQVPASWQVARFSSAVYAYREVNTQWTVIAKFYSAKTGSHAQEYALREQAAIEQARALGLSGGLLRALDALGVWRGVLFLEYVPALHLLDAIAVRRSRPGRLLSSLQAVVRLLATLHSAGTRAAVPPPFEPAANALKYADQLARYGVLADKPDLHASLRRLIHRWQSVTPMGAYQPALIHGDATTTNFLLPEDGTVVAIDWERATVHDPAFDLGRLGAEIAHGVRKHGGQGEEAARMARRICDFYLRFSSAQSGDGNLLGRARFYQAASTLRIARNGWISRKERLALVAQAMALLSESE